LRRDTSVSEHVSLSTDQVPAADRLAYFREALLHDLMPVEIYGDPSASFSAHLEADTLGPITLRRLTGRTPGRHGLRRTPGLIRRGDPGSYGLVMYEQGSAVLTHGHRQVELTAGEMTLIDTSRPYDGSYVSGQGRLLSIVFPREALQLPGAAVDRLCGARLCARSGVGALLSTFTTQLARDIDSYRPSDTARVVATLTDLIGATLAHELEATGTLPAESQRRVLFQQVQTFIEQRLGDPGLTPASVAEAHHVSARTLHRLFEPHGRTVAEWIRLRRLDRCRRDLADPSLDDRPIHAIATRWGLPCAAHFSRVFRAAYGLSPQDYRAAGRAQS
jgi:AraC-like DNA-binding protein